MNELRSIVKQIIKEEIQFKPIKISSDLGLITCHTQEEYEKVKLKLKAEGLYRLTSHDWGSYISETWVNGYEMKKIMNNPI